MSLVKIANKLPKLNGKFFGASDPYNPLHLKPYTLRLRYKDGITPSEWWGIFKQISTSPNIWDVKVTKLNINEWNSLFRGNDNLLEVIGANTTNVTDMTHLFTDCYSLEKVALFDTSKVTKFDNFLSRCVSLKSVPLYDTSNATSIYGMLYRCESLEKIPLFNTSKVTSIDFAFFYCYKVNNGALNLYRQVSSQPNVPEHHAHTFTDCGRDTQNGRWELSLISSDWKAAVATVDN